MALAITQIRRSALICAINTRSIMRLANIVKFTGLKIVALKYEVLNRHQFSITKNWQEGFRMYAIILFAIVFFIILSAIVAAPLPSPHNVEGRITTNSSNGVPNGIPVRINNTVSGNLIMTYTNAPEVPELMGSYSAAIDGNDGDLIFVTAWNSTNYGTNSSNLTTSTTSINVALNLTRPSEANVTIIDNLNNSLKNKTIPFNVTANITMLGNDGIGCNATINFSNKEVINITSGENLTHSLGNITLGSSKMANWSAIGLSDGVSNITVRAECASDGIKLDRVNSYAVENITIQNLAPGIGRILITSPVDLAAGENTTVHCNATISENNTVSDIMIVNATFFQASAGHNAANDNNNHYANSSCANTSSGIFEANYSCGFKLAYYANSGAWQCNMTIVDFSGVSRFSNISSSVNELMAIDASPSIIDYGSLKATNISSTDFNVTIRNFGNIPVNVSIRGFAPNESMAYLNLSMTCQNGNISNANQRYSTLNGSNFAQMNPLNNESQLLNLTLQQRTNDLAFGNDTNSTFFKLQVPALTYGICNGTVIFGAIP